MKPVFINDDFLLRTKYARKLFHEFAEPEPILDYHNHLSPSDIAGNRKFANLWEIWLEGDHYKWRAMRTNGVPERFCTGDATPYEKFLAWARTVPHILRNPLYHWTHLELSRYFGITELLDENSAPRIWAQANEQLASSDMDVFGILSRFKVSALCTTDDPADTLENHRTLARSECESDVFPCFRPDKATMVDKPDVFLPWLARMEQTSGHRLSSFEDLRGALRKRYDFFHSHGCRLSDHGLDHLHGELISASEMEHIFSVARAGGVVPRVKKECFAFTLMVDFAHWNAARGWTMQLHLGALRNNNTRLRERLGPDTGFDSIGDWSHASAVARFLDTLDREESLPKTILYNLNPADNYVFATMLGNFQDGSIPGKIQMGSGWWFLDQKEAMEWQLNALSNLGLLSRFVGMVTDSRSFMSFPRHEYFRRVLCNLLGDDMEHGELPEDFELVGSMVRNICHTNASTHLGLKRSAVERAALI